MRGFNVVAMIIPVEIEQLRKWIGREQTDTEVLTPAFVRRFNATFDRDAPTEIGDRAPMLIHYCLTQPSAPCASLGPDGHPERGDFLPPVPLPRRMWAGSSLTFHGEINVGDLLHRRSTVKNAELKQGRSGRLCFVTVEHEIFCRGHLIVSECQDIVYRDGDTAAGVTAFASQIAPAGSYSRRVVPSAPMLFRYSAITFISHRIHYDKPYAIETEGYPGLVIHGPLQATLLCQIAADLKGRTPRMFRFRSQSPIFDDTDFAINAQEDIKGLRLWTSRRDGPIAMEAFAEW